MNVKVVQISETYDGSNPDTPYKHQAQVEITVDILGEFFTIHRMIELTDAQAEAARSLFGDVQSQILATINAELGDDVEEPSEVGTEEG